MAMFATTLLLVAAIARAKDISTTSQVLSSKPRKLMEALRSKLKENNYDYISYEDSDESIPVRREENTGILRRSHLNEEIVEHYDADYTAVPELLFGSDRLKVRSFYAPKTGDLREAIGIEHRRFMNERDHKEEDLVNATNSLSEEYQGDVEYIFSKKDLVQPADEKNPENFLNHWRIDKDLVTDRNATEAPKFKVLKVKSPSRRSMNRRRLIQEKSERGVAIVNVDQGPIPLFQLPHSRRQYMYNKDSHSTEESLSAAPDSSPTPLRSLSHETN